MAKARHCRALDQQRLVCQGRPVPHPCQDRCVTKRLTVAIPAAMAIASYRYGATGLEYRPSRRPLLDGYGRSAYYYGSEGPRLAHERAAPLHTPRSAAEEPVMPEPRDQMPAAVGRGHRQACHADREQVIGRLKAAFVQGRLLKDELDARVGQAQAARTYANLATLIADLPAGLAAAEPRTSPPGPAHRARYGPLRR